VHNIVDVCALDPVPSTAKVEVLLHCSHREAVCSSRGREFHSTRKVFAASARAAAAAAAAFSASARAAAFLVSEVGVVVTWDQKKTVDSRFLRIEFEGRFVVANTQRPRINGLPTDVDGAEKTSAIAEVPIFLGQ